jgi:hypothetical protein
MQEAPKAVIEGGPMLKARCKRLAGRSKILGNVSFSFNGEGICEVPDQGNNRIWFLEMCKTNGVEMISGPSGPKMSPQKRKAPEAPKKQVVIEKPKIEEPVTEPKSETSVAATAEESIEEKAPKTITKKTRRKKKKESD